MKKAKRGRPKGSKNKKTNKEANFELVEIYKTTEEIWRKK